MRVRKMILWHRAVLNTTREETQRAGLHTQPRAAMNSRLVKGCSKLELIACFGQGLSICLKRN